jgi:hypothetical protein
MFDSGSTRVAAGQAGAVRDDLSLEMAAQLASKEVHDFLGAKINRTFTTRGRVGGSISRIVGLTEGCRKWAPL